MKEDESHREEKREEKKDMESSPLFPLYFFLPCSDQLTKEKNFSAEHISCEFVWLGAFL